MCCGLFVVDVDRERNRRYTSFSNVEYTYLLLKDPRYFPGMRYLIVIIVYQDPIIIYIHKNKRFFSICEGNSAFSSRARDARPQLVWKRAQINFFTGAYERERERHSERESENLGGLNIGGPPLESPRPPPPPPTESRKEGRSYTAGQCPMARNE